MCRRKKKEAEARAMMLAQQRQMQMLQAQRMNQQMYPMGGGMPPMGMPPMGMNHMMQRPCGPNGPLQYGPMGSGATPVAAPSRFIQLTPIVQPIAMVPYSTQNQPLLMYDAMNSLGTSIGNNMSKFGGPSDYFFDDDDEDF